MKKLVLIGCGDHSERYHAPAMADMARQSPGRIELAGCCDVNAARAQEFARRFGFARAWYDWRTMLADVRPDAAICVLPVSQNAAVAAEMLQRGLPFVTEKPIAASAREAELLAAAAERQALPHMVSLNRRFSPYLTAALDLARRCGPIRYLRGSILRHNRRESEFAFSTGVHVLDAMVFAGGAVSGLEVRKLPGSELSSRWCTGRLEFAGGAVGHFEMLPTVGMSEESYEFCGEGFRASVQMYGGGPRARLWHEGKLELDLAAPADQPPFITDGAQAELRHFVECLETGQTPSPSIAQALPATLLAWQVCQELQQGK